MNISLDLYMSKVLESFAHGLTLRKIRVLEIKRTRILKSAVLECPCLDLYMSKVLESFAHELTLGKISQ
jgi:hypothetical protein